MGLSYNFSAQTIAREARTDFNFDTNAAKLFPEGIRVTNNTFASAGVSIQQHLLKDFWIDSYRERLLIRRTNLKMSEQAFRFEVMRTVLAVALGYYDLSASREAIRVDEQALELKQQFLAETRRRVQVGDLPPLDAEQAETQLQNTLTVLTAARELFVSQQNALKDLFTDNFKEWMDVEVDPADHLFVVPTTPNRAESFANALATRPDLLEARLAVEKSDVIVRFNLNQLFPNLDFIGGYAGLGIEPGSSAARSDAIHFRNPEYFYGMVVSFPLSNVAERNNYRASKAAKEISTLQLRKAEQGVLVQVADWVNRVQSRFSQVDSTRKARDYAQSALAAEQKKLENGFSTSFFVLQLQEALTAARTAELLARADYNKALVQLAFADGSILEKHHLTVEVK
jgi:outer membrane protein TolC